MIRVKVAPELITQFLTAGNEIPPTTVVTGLPPGCELTDIEFEYDSVQGVNYVIARFREPVEAAGARDLDIVFYNSLNQMQADIRELAAAVRHAEPFVTRVEPIEGESLLITVDRIMERYPEKD